MASLHRARVVAFGTEEDMTRLHRVMLENCDWLEAPEDRPPYSLEELSGQVHVHSSEEGGENCGFFYGMVAPVTYGEAEPSTCRLTVRETPCGLWTACFAYDGLTAFQPEDWLRLHQRCNRLPMLALHASWDFAREKGMTVFTGGRAEDCWDRMNETWLWLIQTYEWSYPPEEAVTRLMRLSETMAREECDMTVDELLDSCRRNLLAIAADTADAAEIRERMASCRRERDYGGLFSLQCRVAETELWATEHNARWLACLDAVEAAWRAREA